VLHLHPGKNSSITKRGDSLKLKQKSQAVKMMDGWMDICHGANGLEEERNRPSIQPTNEQIWSSVPCDV